MSFLTTNVSKVETSTSSSSLHATGGVGRSVGGDVTGDNVGGDITGDNVDAAKVGK